GNDTLAEVNPATQAITATYNTPFLDENISMSRGGQSYYYMQDGLGSVRQLLNPLTQQPLNSYDYNAWGESVSEQELVPNTFKYTGREWDNETSNYYFRSRYYSPAIGKFNQKDGIGFDGGFNLYIYVENNPNISTDPFGLLKYTVKEGDSLEKIYVSLKYDEKTFGLDEFIKTVIVNNQTKYPEIAGDTKHLPGYLIKQGWELELPENTKIENSANEEANLHTSLGFEITLGTKCFGPVEFGSNVVNSPFSQQPANELMPEDFADESDAYIPVSTNSDDILDEVFNRLVQLELPSAWVLGLKGKIIDIRLKNLTVTNTNAEWNDYRNQLRLRGDFFKKQYDNIILKRIDELPPGNFAELVHELWHAYYKHIEGKSISTLDQERMGWYIQPIVEGNANAFEKYNKKQEASLPYAVSDWNAGIIGSKTARPGEAYGAPEGKLQH
ncbi:MAG: RHS repeat-associated core domain-containing protein, partial [Planctomycetes bacterium]|nr:RHS repeat-associated core domain-containing protein [Planctomycetota bacterium]